jgi:hypothetical protein
MPEPTPRQIAVRLAVAVLAVLLLGAAGLVVYNADHPQQPGTTQNSGGDE